MTLRQEAYEKISCLPDDSVRLVIALMDEMLRRSDQSASLADSRENGSAAFADVMEYRRLRPFPKDIDWENARKEAIAEKYGRFD